MRRPSATTTRVRSSARVAVPAAAPAPPPAASAPEAPAAAGAPGYPVVQMATDALARLRTLAPKIRRPRFTEVRWYQTKFLVIGVEYFQRDVVKWKGFLDEPQWYASGHGVGMRVSIREIGWSR